MEHEKDKQGPLESVGKAVDESLTAAAAFGAGKLTRSQFDAWYAKRSAESAGLIVNLRARTMRFLEPFGAAVEQGWSVVGGAPAKPPRRTRRRRAGPRRSVNLSSRQD